MLFTSCVHDTISLQYNSQPTNLQELHNGFFEVELNPEIGESKTSPTTIITFGHTYPLLKYPLVFESFVNTIKQQNPDYVFVLGDIIFDNTQKEWDLFSKHFKGLKNKLYFAPGNHDLNYHYERYVGKTDNQFEAEQRYIENISYRYKLLNDVNANFVFINMNDSVERVLQYLKSIEKYLDNDKQNFFLSSQCVWHASTQNPDDVKTWPLKSFKREELLPHLEQFDYLVHGDWNKKFYRGYWPKKNGKFHTLAVGNKRKGDSLFITRLEVFKDTVLSFSIDIKLPKESNWYK